jgi:hypothetical protein
MPTVTDKKYLEVLHNRVDLREQVWLDHVLVDHIDDLSRREALARSSRQETLSLALTAQVACFTRLRDLCHSRYWALLNGTAAKVE